MNSYEEYLESIIDLREQEIARYKEFIERTLRCCIRQEIVTIEEEYSNPDGVFEKAVPYKAITIPETQFFVRLG